MIKITDLTKNSRWKLGADTQSYTRESPYSYFARGVTGPNGECRFLDRQYFGPIVGAGSEIEFSRKIANFGSDKDSVGYLGQMMAFIIEFPGQDAIELVIPFSEIKDNIEMLEQPKDVKYLIRDSVSGHFYKGSFEDRYKTATGKEIITEYAGQIIKSNWKKSVGYFNTTIGTTVKIEWGKTPGVGKQMKTLAQAKQRLMFIIGYYNELGENAPGMLFNTDIIDEIPSTWEIIAYDKVGKTFDVVENARTYIDGVNRLKVLTVKYGSAVRDLYKKLEKKDQLGEYTGILAFTPKRESQTEYANSTGHDGGVYVKICDSEIKSVKEIVDRDMQKSFQSDSCAIAFKTINDAVFHRMRYTGGLKCTAIDMTTMNEEVGAA